MSFSVGTIFALLKGDTGGFVNAMDNAGKSVKRLEDEIDGLTFKDAAAGAAVFAGALTFASGVAVKFASDAQETASALDAVFGKSGADSIDKWADQASAAVGRSSNAMKEQAAVLGAMLKPMTGSADAALRMSQTLSTLAVDLGSFFNVADSDVLTAVKAGLTGESEPLKRFGVVMNEASLNAFALANGLKMKTNAMTEAEKVTLRYAFILSQTKDAQGDAARTANSFGNQMKRLQGNARDVATTFGEALLPAATSILQGLNGIADSIAAMDPAWVSFAAYATAATIAVATLAAGFFAFMAFVPSIAAGLKMIGLSWTVVGTATKAALLPLLQFALIAIGVIALAGAMKTAWDANLFGIRDGVAQLGDVFGGMWDWVSDKFWKTMGAITEGLAFVIDMAKDVGVFENVDTIGMRARAQNVAAGGARRDAVLAPWKEAAGDAGDAIVDGGKAVAGFFGDQFAMFGDTLKKGFDVLNPFGGGASSAIVTTPDDDTKKATDELLASIKGLKKDEKEKKAKEYSGGAMTFAPMEIEGVATAEAWINRSVAQAGQDVGKAILSGASNLGSIVDGAINGFATAGIQGAIVAGGAALLMESEQFGTMIRMISGIVQIVADTFGILLEPLKLILGAVQILVSAALAPLGPIFELVGSLLAPLAPPLVALGAILQGLSPVIEIVAMALMAIANPLLFLAGPIMQGLFHVIRYVGAAILAVVTPIADFWNFVVETLQGFLRSLAELDIAGVKPFAFLEGAAKGMDAWKADTQAMRDAQQNLLTMTWESATAEAAAVVQTYELNDAMNDAGNAARDVAEELTNVPNGFKIALARFRATDVGPKSGGSGGNYGAIAPEEMYGIPKLAKGGIATRRTLAEIGEGGEPEAVIPLSELKRMLGGGVGGGMNVTINVNGAKSPKEIAREVLRELRRIRATQSGTPSFG